MTKHKTVCTAVFAALFSLGLAGAALAQATPATPPANAQKGQTTKDSKAKSEKDKAAKSKDQAQGKKKGADEGKKTGIEKKKSS
jgi:Ni/Co efflux regulator RcnB